MVLLFKHSQEKKDRKGESISKGELNLYKENDLLKYKSCFDFNYSSYGKKKNITFEHQLCLNIKNGDIETTYKIVNDNVTEDNLFRTSTKIKKNDFKSLKSLCIFGFERGEKRSGFWGVKYTRAVDVIFNKIFDLIKTNFKSEYYIQTHQTNYIKDKYQINRLYDLIVDFHLDRKEIKGHDNVYNDILFHYPKKKWLLKNDNKFLPSVLDSFGIKSKYFIGEIQTSETPININSLNYLCKLFGDNHIDYIKKINWKLHCIEEPSNQKIHNLKNDNEKKCLIKVINNWDMNLETMRIDSLIHSLKNIFTIRSIIEDKGIVLSFNPKNVNQFDNILEQWLSIKLHLTRGYKMMYTIPVDMVKEIEEDIICNQQIYKPKVLITEDDYRVEGHMMKNCMSKQFIHGALYLYISLRNNKKRINLQYRKGSLVQSYGKANTPTHEIFLEPISVLNRRLEKYIELTWKKDRYDFLS